MSLRSATAPPPDLALSADKVRGLANSELVHSSATALSAAPLTYFMRRDDRDFVVFCFAKPEEAEVFASDLVGSVYRRRGDEPSD